ncbi:MAG: MFS transporter [Candidatus Helarchaeota archaeon]
MPLITESRKYKYVLYSSNYLIQGLSAILILTILPIYLKNYKGLSDLSIATIAGVSVLPIILKPVAAIFSDSFAIKALGGNRKPYIIFGFIFNSLMLYLLGIVEPTEFLYLFVLVWVLQSLGLTLMDVGMDALVIESFDNTKERLIPNVIFTICSVVAIFVALPIAMICEQNAIHIGARFAPELEFHIFIGGNFDVGFLAASAVSICFLLPTVFLKEQSENKVVKKVSIDDIKKFLNTKHVPIVLLFFFLLYIDSGMIDFTLDPFFRVLGMNSGSQLVIFSPLVFISVLGAVSSHWIMKKGMLKLFMFIGVLGTAFYIVMAILTLTASPIILTFYIGMGIIFSFTSGAAVPQYATLGMSISDKKIAATSFTIIMTVWNLGRLLGILVAGIVPFGIYTKMGIIFLLSAIAMSLRIPVIFKLRELEPKDL